jgi:hypothetical protein
VVSRRNSVSTVTNSCRDIRLHVAARSAVVVIRSAPVSVAGSAVPVAGEKRRLCAPELEFAAPLARFPFLALFSPPPKGFLLGPARRSRRLLCEHGVRRSAGRLLALVRSEMRIQEMSSFSPISAPSSGGNDNVELSLDGVMIIRRLFRNRDMVRASTVLGASD